MKKKWMFVALGYVLLLAALGLALDVGNNSSNVLHGREDHIGD